MSLPAYATVLLLPALAIAGLLLGGAWTWALPAVIFGLVPLAELFLRGSTDNPSPDQEARRRDGRGFDLLVYSIVPLQLGILLLLLVRAPQLGGLELAGAVLSVGICGGGLGMNAAHELGHRPGRLDRWLARLLLTSVLYQHFHVEHNRGHHARVATPDDAATARVGDVLYPFWLRSIAGGLRSSWQLEADRLARKGRSAWTWDNEVLRGHVAHVVVLALVAVLAGPVGLAAFVGASTVAILLLETVNYVEHYGLARQQRPDGRYERTRPAHSWNSNRPLGRVLLFDLTRHSDHHAFPARPYQLLRHHDEAPELPTGYPGMILLALVPPLFHAVMHRRIRAETARLQAA